MQPRICMVSNPVESLLASSPLPSLHYPMSMCLMHSHPFLASHLSQSEGVLLSCVLATLQHSIYASVFYSKTVVQVLRGNHTAFIAFAYALKIITVVVMSVGAYSKYGLPDTTSPLFSVGLALIAYGCHLNFMVHVLLGTTAIYYGQELGLLKEIKWITAYPYNTFNHPQYLGAALQLVGAVCLCGFEKDLTHRADIVGAGAYMCALYALTIQVEKRSPPVDK